MGLEIERKFLVVNDSWKGLAETSSQLKQGYLASTPNATVRVRIEDGVATLNIKGATVGFTRHEYEYGIPLQDAEELMQSLLVGSAIDKVRYRVPYAGHVWEIDVFDGANGGLIVAELELASETESFEQPDWLGEEISQDARYYNACLAQKPFTTW
jgi:adenylate cyclase